MNRRLSVATDKEAGPYLFVELDQLDGTRARLDRHAIPYWVDADAISLDGKSPATVINFGKTASSQQIQAILDEE